MASCILFHGPGARSAALTEASQLGRLIHPPFGDEGLKIDEAREVVELLSSTPMGSEMGTLVVGPMDELARADSFSPLLKPLEEFDGETTQPILWAHDNGGVPATIRSRCLERFAPATGAEEDDEALQNAAFKAVESALKVDRVGIIEAFKIGVKKDSVRPFLWAMCDSLSMDLQKAEVRALWERLRNVARWSNPTVIETLSALLPEV